jgi:hypothetical protein
MISKVLQQLHNLDLNVDYFYAFTVSSSTGRFLGHYNDDLVKYIEEKGFFKIDYLYEDNEDMIEYKNGSIFITLDK